MAEMAQASGKDIFAPLAGETPDPNAAHGRKEGGITVKKYELCLRLDEPEAARLRADAKRCGLSRTAYLRRLILGAELKARPSEEIRKLRTEIHHIGNNANQIARKINAGFGKREDAERIQTLLKQVYALMYEIAKE